MTPPTSVQTVTAELLPLTFEGIEDFLCEGNCKNPGMCNDTEITWCGRKAEAFVKSIATLTSSLTAAEARIRELEAMTDVRWAVNVLLEKIAVKFENWDTLDIWRSNAADAVREFKHRLDSAALSQTEDGPR